MSEWGNPIVGDYSHFLAEFIGQLKLTQGSETSQYLEEEKSKRDTPSSGERTGYRPNQTTSVVRGCRALTRDS